ncbi:MAG TPA: class I SAM-dependent methyltransferase, partial [Gammaproteobacteria bacterium]|nr:class I SAM-dependent methyltransferase [Gammaproteobacteria bacterium]
MDEIILTKTPAIQHSQRLENHIKEQIRLQFGPTTFSDFMQMALYTPGLGYYSSGTCKFGAGGDFVTAPEIGPLFAQCVAVQFAEILAACNGDTILELGAGSGQFACDVLQALHTQ